MEFTEAIKTRRSIRQYKTDSLPEGALERLRQALSLAPSGNNGQPCTFIFVQEPAARAELVKRGCHQEGFANAPLIVVACCKKDHEFDCAIAVDHLILAATAEGLGSCWVGWINRDEIKSLLGIPAEIEVPVVVPIGFAGEHPAARPRKPLSELVKAERWG